MGTVTISGNTYQIYGTDTGGLSSADAYWAAALGTGATSWAAATQATKDAALVQATRLLDRQSWKGSPVGTPQIDVVLQWPRTGVTDRSGAAVSSLSVPDQVVKACYELAGAILVDPTLATTEMSGKNIKRASPGGGVSVEYFVPTLGISGRFPVQVQELVGQFLDSSTASAYVSGSAASGADGTAVSQFSDGGAADFDINRGL